MNGWDALGEGEETGNQKRDGAQQGPDGMAGPWNHTDIVCPALPPARTSPAASGRLPSSSSNLERLGVAGRVDEEGVAVT